MNESSATGNSVTIDPLRVFHAIPEYVQGTGTAVVGKPPPAASSTGTASAALADNPLSKRNRAINRKTSAEIVQEAKTMLSRGTPSNSTMSHNSMQSNASTLKFDGSFKVSGKSSPAAPHFAYCRCRLLALLYCTVIVLLLRLGK